MAPQVLKLLKMAKGIRSLLDTVMQALPQVGNLGLLFFLLFFIFAALGVELFGRLGRFLLVLRNVQYIFCGKSLSRNLLSLMLTVQNVTRSIPARDWGSTHTLDHSEWLSSPSSEYPQVELSLQLRSRTRRILK